MAVTYLYVFRRGGITAAIHRSDILEHIVRQHAGAIGDGFILMQDNARAHRAQVSMTFIYDTDVSVMIWPARFPDVNPTEHAWGLLFRHIRQQPHHPKNVQNRMSTISYYELTQSPTGIQHA